MLLCSANGICAICSIPTKNLTTRLGRTYLCTRTRRSRVPPRLSVARWRCQFSADCTTNISERRFPTETPIEIPQRSSLLAYWGVLSRLVQENGSVAPDSNGTGRGSGPEE
jgi:hypothetical protein